MAITCNNKFRIHSVYSKCTFYISSQSSVVWTGGRLNGYMELSALLISIFCVLCFAVTRSSIPGHRPVGMGGEGKCKHMHKNTAYQLDTMWSLQWHSWNSSTYSCHYLNWTKVLRQSSWKQGHLEKRCVYFIFTTFLYQFIALEHILADHSLDVRVLVISGNELR